MLHGGEVSSINPFPDTDHLPIHRTQLFWPVQWGGWNQVSTQSSATCATGEVATQRLLLSLHLPSGSGDRASPSRGAKGLLKHPLSPAWVCNWAQLNPMRLEERKKSIQCKPYFEYLCHVSPKAAQSSLIQIAKLFSLGYILVEAAAALLCTRGFSKSCTTKDLLNQLEVRSYQTVCLVSLLKHC